MRVVTTCVNGLFSWIADQVASPPAPLAFTIVAMKPQTAENSENTIKLLNKKNENNLCMTWRSRPVLVTSPAFVVNLRNIAGR